MSIAKATILSKVNAVTLFADTDIDKELLATLVDLTIEIPQFHLTAQATTVAGQAAYNLRDFPEDFRRLDAVRIDDGEPLSPIYTLEDYLTKIAEDTTADRDEPREFLLWNDILYLWPTPDLSTYAINLYASKIEGDVDDIDLPDYFEPAIVEGVIWERYKNQNLGNQSYAQVHKAQYEVWKQKLLSAEGRKMNTTGRVAYTDI